MTTVDCVDQRTVRRFPDGRVEMQGDGCWIWRGAVNSSGYGEVRVGEVQRRAHRVMFEFFYGPIPNDLTVDHLCRVPQCVNPLHMELVTVRENIRRGGNAAKTHCRKGHPLSGLNLYVTPDGRRKCRTCSRNRSRGRNYS